ncbi:hypothetical protein M3Y99_00400100 [Aphelenchoides fujianensis]|nr:hypothetical protein M3Y99_00400100 [Aphelenchoides fujianensis]
MTAARSISVHLLLALASVSPWQTRARPTAFAVPRATARRQVQCQPQSCQPGYSCGHYGCARNRARSSLTYKDGTVVPIDVYLNSTAPKRNIFGVERRKDTEDEQPKMDYGTFAKMTNPNNLFRQCCEDRRLPDACLSKCNFNVFNKAALEAMYFKNDACPLEASADIQYCAAQGRDHRPCCFRNGIQSTAAGEKCLAFCDQRAGQVIKLDFSYLPCYDKQWIKKCFFDDVKSRMEEKLRPRLDKDAS